MDVQGEDFLERVRKMRVTRLSRSAQHPGLVLLMRCELVKRERERERDLIGRPAWLLRDH